MTSKQKKYFNIIKKFIEEHHFSPTIKELCELTGNSSPATINAMLYRLKEKGYIDFVPRKARTISICYAE